MKLLIDTHIFLWLLFEPKKIPEKQLKLLRSSENELYICSISFWEISLKYNLGKLKLTGVSPDTLPKLAKDMNITVAEMNADIMAAFYKLDKPEQHKDPFDRAIVWMCIVNSFTLVSRDNSMKTYQSKGLKLLEME